MANESTFYADHWHSIEDERFERYQRMFVWRDEQAALIEPLELKLTIHRPFVSGLPVGEFVIAGETARAFRIQTSWRLLGPWAQRSPLRTRLTR